MRHHFQAEQWLPYPIEHVFAFFSNPENLPRLMPAWQKARIEEAAFAPPPPRPAGLPIFPGIVAGAGTRMTISFRPIPFSPIRVPWDAEITEFTWNEHFCDVQHRGPFKFWRHCHRLTPEPRANTGREVQGTLIRDEVEYELPLGPLGELAAKLFAPAQFKSIFDFRHKRTAELMPLLRVRETPRAR
ncbi:SRPBCC family protein [Granulicella tundricola]|uniref:Cyclase/dehydrase n=1 Tax=Granulicella tundricola (strain ATCC BAA-1859 / DSM 23138 / MP5ACTX9) TaxID=1198114 RepID=E8WXQ8_GRATM|nr:SRPBCC family protein [Granulicella tundricola]ADW69753.1 cyclase/dehydrase [Granulicella tundricola MP5ACTX9]